MDVGKRGDNVRASRQQDGLPPVVLRPWGIVRHHQFGGPVEVDLSQRELGLALVDAGNLGAQQGDLVVDVLHGVLQRPAPAHGLRFDAAHFGLRYREFSRRRIHRRLFDRDCDLKGLLVQLDQQVSLVDPVVVVDEDARHLAFDAGGHERHVTIDVGVIGRDGVERRLDPGNTEPKRACQDHKAQCSEQRPSPPGGLRGLGQDCRSAGRVLRGWARIRLAGRSRLVAWFLRLAALLAHGRFPSQNG